MESKAETALCAAQPSLQHLGWDSTQQTNCCLEQDGMCGCFVLQAHASRRGKESTSRFSAALLHSSTHLQQKTNSRYIFVQLPSHSKGKSWAGDNGHRITELCSVDVNYIPPLVLLTGGGRKTILYEESCDEWRVPDLKLHTQLLSLWNVLKKLKWVKPQLTNYKIYTSPVLEQRWRFSKVRSCDSATIWGTSTAPQLFLAALRVYLRFPPWQQNCEPTSCSSQGKYKMCKMIFATALLWIYCFCYHELWILKYVKPQGTEQIMST